MEDKEKAGGVQVWLRDSQAVVRGKLGGVKKKVLLRIAAGVMSHVPSNIPWKMRVRVRDFFLLLVDD